MKNVSEIENRHSTLAEGIKEILKSHMGKALSARELSEMLGSTTPSINVTLYYLANKKRVRWLKSKRLGIRVFYWYSENSEINDANESSASETDV